MKHSWEIGDKVKHPCDRAPFIVTGIRPEEIEIEGDWSGGTNPSKGKAWVHFASVKGFTQLVSAFPGTGKTYYAQHRRGWKQKVLDSDSSKFPKDRFPENYIISIKEYMGYGSIVFISSHKEVREALYENGMWFTLVYPDVSLKQEYLGRYKERGSSEEFINLVDKNWDNWIQELKEQKGCHRIELKSGQFIADVI